MNKIKEIAKKISAFLRVIFGYGIAACLFAGGLTFFGYLAALIIGGDAAVLICDVIYNTVTPIIIYASTCLVLLGLVVMYLNGEMALTSSKKKAVKHRGET